jgi:hypothetical protein
MTPDQRSTYPLCGARRRDGERCRKFAGEGTNHKGTGRCKFLGGSTPTHVASAVIQEARRRSLEFGEPVDVEPADALMMMLQLSAGHVAWVRQELSYLEDRATFEGQVLMRLYGEERDRVARIAKAALDSGVQERLVRLAEKYGELLAGLIQEILGDPDLELTVGQRERAPSVVRRHLAALQERSSATA